jgi:hypothetical protein
MRRLCSWNGNAIAPQVGGVTRQWAEGRVLVLDDSFEHEVCKPRAFNATRAPPCIFHEGFTIQNIEGCVSTVSTPFGCHPEYSIRDSHYKIHRVA